jgi:hypothetical protein
VAARRVPGATLDYLVHVTNTSANPVNPVVHHGQSERRGARGAHLRGRHGDHERLRPTVSASPATSSPRTTLADNLRGRGTPGTREGTIDLRFRCQARQARSLPARSSTNTRSFVALGTPQLTASASVSLYIWSSHPTTNLVLPPKSGPATMRPRWQWGHQFGLHVPEYRVLSACVATVSCSNGAPHVGLIQVGIVPP